jgi:hypothetical protein
LLSPKARRHGAGRIVAPNATPPPAAAARNNRRLVNLKFSQAMANSVPVAEILRRHRNYLLSVAARLQPSAELVSATRQLLEPIECECRDSGAAHGAALEAREGRHVFNTRFPPYQDVRIACRKSVQARVTRNLSTRTTNDPFGTDVEKPPSAQPSA